MFNHIPTVLLNGLRSYGTHPQIWFNGKELCDKHEWKYENNNSFCTNCNAWRGELGLEPTFELYLQHLWQIFDEIKRVLKKTGTCWVNIGDSYAGSPSGNPTYKNWETGGVKDASDNYRADLKKDNGNIQPKSLLQIPSRFSIGMTDRGWILRNSIIWYKRNCMPSSAKDRFTVDYEMVYFFTKSRKYYFEQQFEENQGKDERRWSDNYDNVGSIIQGDTNAGVKRTKRYSTVSGRNKRCVWDIKFMSSEECAWLAAMIDGEGTLYVGIQNETNNRNKKYFRPRIEIQMMSKAVIERCKQITHVGSIYKRIKKENSKMIFTWSLSGKEIVPILEQIYHYLIIKKEQAELLIMLVGLNQTGRNQYSEDKTYKIREEIAEEVSFLNQHQYDTPPEELNKGSVFDVTPKPFSEAHFAVFPQELIETPIKAGCPEGGIVLDPFIGSGTTGIVANKLNRNFIGIELKEEYLVMANKRIDKELGFFKNEGEIK